MKKIILLIAIVFTVIGISAQGGGIVGTWKTIDDETGKAKSYVEIFKKGNKYYGKVVKILNPDKQNAKCDECDDDDPRKGKKVMGMEIVKDLEFDDDDKDYSGGTILDPNNGKVYTCKMWLKDKNTLSVRGYVMFFFRTQTWHRVK